MSRDSIVAGLPPPSCPGPTRDALGNGHSAGPNARSSLTFVGLLLFWATRNTRQK